LAKEEGAVKVGSEKGSLDIIRGQGELFSKMIHAMFSIL